MRFSLVPLAGLWLLAACQYSEPGLSPDLLADPAPSSAPTQPAARPTTEAAPSAVHTLSSGSEPAAIAELVARGRERCPDEFLSRNASADTELALRVEDARADRRTILPLDLIVALGGGPDVGIPSGARYAAELLISAYDAPRHFRRLNAPRAEWAAGRLQAQLVVWDLGERRVICQAPLSVRGDASGAPIRRRLRESTRRSLEGKLQERARGEMNTAISSISSVFRLRPPPSTKPSARGS